ncbi:MAG: tRNA (adenosine(37)-N6)-threonylcarbamoyltransferase complex transferase subunit TsaD [Endomicrobium sp.]|jgi:N6-L-threonylcarbamoyladenine synthase|nr:tRNA (adenosine(37)-N6)-threonylcarbamoyltransferase complex transferase subunit TsaD [Endomicrobium sp.]
MNILAIETSCDETSVAVLLNGFDVKSVVISSQINIHAKFYGVVPELASRAHIDNINIVLARALDKAHITFSTFKKQIDAIAFTVGPGLSGALLIGEMVSKSLSYAYNKPLIPVNHLEGHIYSAMLNNKLLRPPFLALIISGGHTSLIIVRKFGIYELLGETRDDAVGEAFDKVAKMLGMLYPGGPIIDSKSQNGNPYAVHFTRPYLNSSWDFSFSGIKTAVLNYIKKNHIHNESQVDDLCASFNQAIVDTLCVKTFKAAEHFNMKQIVLGGGVSSNSMIRKAFISLGKSKQIQVFIPSHNYCTDNAAIIGCAAYIKQLVIGVDYNIDQIRSNANSTLENWNKKYFG